MIRECKFCFNSIHTLGVRADYFTIVTDNIPLKVIEKQ